MRKLGTSVLKGCIVLIFVFCQFNFSNGSYSCFLNWCRFRKQHPTTISKVEPSNFTDSKTTKAEINSTPSSLSETTELGSVKIDQSSSSSTSMTPNYESYQGDTDEGKMIKIVIFLSLTIIVVVIIVGVIILYHKEYFSKFKRTQSNSQETVKMSVIKDSSEEHAYGNMAAELPEVDSVTYASLEFLPTTSAIRESTLRPVTVLDHRTDYAVIQKKKY